MESDAQRGKRYAQLLEVCNEYDIAVEECISVQDVNRCLAVYRATLSESKQSDTEPKAEGKDRFELIELE